MKKKELLLLINDLQNQVVELQYEVRKLKVQLDNKQDRATSVYIPSLWPVDGTHEICSDGGMHDYPNPWHATVPPPCRKCGKLAQSFTVTSSTTTLDTSKKKSCVGCGCKL